MSEVLIEKISSSASGKRLVLVNTDSPVIKDSNGNVIQYKIIAKLPAIGKALVLINFPSAGDYYVYEGTPVETEGLAEIYDWSDLSGFTDLGSITKEVLDFFFPVFAKHFDVQPFGSGHPQGFTLGDGDDKYKIFISVQDGIVVFDVRTWEKIDEIDMRGYFTGNQNHIGDPYYYKGKLILPVEYWNGSTGTEKEIWIFNYRTKELEKRIPVSAGSDIASVWYDGTYFYVCDFVENKVRKLDENGNVVEEIDGPTDASYPQGITVLDDGRIVCIFEYGNLIGIYDGTSWKTLISYGWHYVEGIEYRDGVLALGFDLTKTMLRVIFMARGKVLHIDTGSTTGGNAGIYITKSENLTALLLIMFGFKSDEKETNKAPGVGLVTDADNGMISEVTVSSFILREFSGGSFYTRSELYLDSDIDKDLTAYPFDSYWKAVGAGVVGIRRSSTTYKGSLQNMNDIWYTDSYTGDVHNNLLVRVYRTSLIYGPLIIFGYQESDPDVTITEYGRFVIDEYPDKVDVQAGQSFSINVKVRNDGNASGSATVRLVDHGGNVVDAVDVTLDAGAETSVTLSGTAPSSPGTYTWKVEVYNKDTGAVDDSKDITLNVSSPAYQYLGDILTALLTLLPYIIMLVVFVMLISALISALR